MTADLSQRSSPSSATDSPCFVLGRQFLRDSFWRYMLQELQQLCPNTRRAIILLNGVLVFGRVYPT